MSVSYTVSDPIHGDVDVLFDPETGVVEVSNGGSLATLTRTVSSPHREGIPIGTRAQSELSLTLDGDAGKLEVGKGVLSRRSYTVSAVVDGSTLTFVPVDDANSAFIRDGNRLALFSKDEETDPRRTDAVWTTPPTRNELVVGYALAEAFDCGALNGAVALFESLILGTPQ
ncbi:hypothetical protein [Rhodococcus sp. ARC_M6]|uniref:hypothetical protein n=1 Tax=Rhodococcus sp. ARC_M6 TaxID=2928852 RepID=UPI001FB52680|nr:hypothetical protein [Rhodococcus sp. ARC_M6]MCJ0904919.1 hypothetical protein [Rhodococcus sp. ARC_M6]